MNIQNNFSIQLSNQKQLIISQASLADAAHIVAFLNMIGGETDFLTFGANEFPISIDEEKATIAECIKSNMNLMLVGKIDNEIIAHLFLQRSNNPRLRHIGDIGISVSKKYWGFSIGKHMMQTAITWAAINHITKIQLQVRTDNERAVQLYKKLGFAIEGTLTRALKINNMYFNDYIMGLHLEK